MVFSILVFSSYEEICSLHGGILGSAAVNKYVRLLLVLFIFTILHSSIASSARFIIELAFVSQQLSKFSSPRYVHCKNVAEYVNISVCGQLPLS